MSRLDNLHQVLIAQYGEAAIELAFDELTLTVAADQWQNVCEHLCDERL